ncbi:MAG TPA: aminoacyl-tRNA hydrolase [Candidatus Babeliales bacterium]|nr:aminoacyl-tRNA hydrolase [Candidatus Babeliales bacterium]
MTNFDLRVIIGLGNPGPQFIKTRHNIGFRVLDALADQYQGAWCTQHNLNYAWTEIAIAEQRILLVKPQTYMNDTGKVLPHLAKSGFKVEQLLVVHDELELPFGVLKFKQGGSAKGHNGLKSLISGWGDNFLRLRFGIDRPARGDANLPVDKYVLAKFLPAEEQALPDKIVSAVQMITALVTGR